MFCHVLFVAVTIFTVCTGYCVCYISASLSGLCKLQEGILFKQMETVTVVGLSTLVMLLCEPGRVQNNGADQKVKTYFITLA